MSEIGKSNSVKNLNPLNAAPMANKPNQVSEEKLRQVSDMYENHFIREMMRQMRSTVHEGGFIKQNNAEKIFRDQLDDQYADQWGKSGGIGLSNLIYDQLMERYGERFGLKQAVEKPLGPLDLNQKSLFSGHLAPLSENSAKINETDPMTFKFQTADKSNLELKNPWAGTLLDKKHLEMDQIQYRIKHDNGLESLILTQGTGLGPEHKLSLGDTIQAGQQLGWVRSASPLFWTVKPSVSE